MNKEPKFDVYCGQHIDLIMGTAVCVTYIQWFGHVAIFARYLEETTINYAELVALNLGLERLITGSQFHIHTNSRYVYQVVLNCQTWRNKNSIEEKAYPEEVEKLLTHLDRLGTGEIDFIRYQNQRDDLMTRLLKHAKHFYHEAQLEMIDKKTTTLRPDLFQDPPVMAVKDLPGSIIWKKPLSVGVFQKKMAQTRTRLKLITSAP